MSRQKKKKKEKQRGKQEGYVASTFIMWAYGEKKKCSARRGERKKKDCNPLLAQGKKNKRERKGIASP